MNAANASSATTRVLIPTSAVPPCAAFTRRRLNPLRRQRQVVTAQADHGTHTMRRTKAALIYRRTKNLRVVQLLLGHSKLESTVRYLGIDVDDALEIAEQTEV